MEESNNAQWLRKLGRIEKHWWPEIYQMTVSHLEVKLPIHYKYMLVLSIPIIWYDLFTTKSLLHGFDCSIALYLPHECSMFYITMQV